MAIHSTLSSIMGKKRIKQRHLAEMIGVSNTTINSLYNDKVTKVSYDILNSICKALDCDICDLLEYVPDED